VKLLRRRQPEPEPADRTGDWEELLKSYRTWAPRSVVRDRYHREARQRREQQRAGKKASVAPDPSESRLRQSSSAAPPQPRAETVSTAPAPLPEPVPSEPPAPVPEPKTSDEWAYEQFVAFEKLCGNGDRITERIEEARTYEPEEAPPEYVW
jgi:hypothetical protein